MFWNDPNLYSATLPFKEFGNFPYKEFGATPTPFMGPTFNPWQNIPKFVPPTLGTLPYCDPRVCDPRMFAQPWMQTPAFNPFVQPLPTPFAQPWMQTPPVNPFGQTQPFTQPFNVTLPLHNPYRPFLY